MSDIARSLRRDLAQLYRKHGRQPLAGETLPLLEPLTDEQRLYRVEVSVYVLASTRAEAQATGLLYASHETQADSIELCSARHKPPDSWRKAIPYGEHTSELTVEQHIEAMRERERQSAEARKAAELAQAQTRLIE